jgi:glycosyltransferase involved in cell wall biosynthesis
VNLDRFAPAPAPRAAAGPLRVCYVGTLDLRKGFVYLLRAARMLGADHVALEMVEATGDRGSKALLARERVGLNLTVRPGDPAPAYQRAEVFVLPSLEDGFGFVTAEAMASGLPVIVTDQCGSAEWVRPGDSGWVVRAGDAGALAAALDAALARRSKLGEMGRVARASIEQLDPASMARRLADWVEASTGSPAASLSL